MEKRSLSNLEYSVIAQELDSLLKAKWFSKFQLIGEETYRLKLGPENLIIAPGKCVYVSSKKEFESTEDGFSSAINRFLKGARLDSVTQLNNDRLLIFSFGERKLVLEQFGKGNIIALENDVIVLCHHPEAWKDRKIQKNEQYKPPMAQQFPSSLDRFKAHLYSDKKLYAVVSLSRLPIGSSYTKHLLFSLGIEEKKRAVDIDDSTAQKIYEILLQWQSSKSFFGYYSGDSLEEFLFVDLELPGLEKKPFPSCFQLIEQYYSGIGSTQSSGDKRRKGLEQQLERMKQDESSKRSIAEQIYLDHSELEGILSRVKGGEQKGESTSYFFEVTYPSGKVLVRKKQQG